MTNIVISILLTEKLTAGKPHSSLHYVFEKGINTEAHFCFYFTDGIHCCFDRLLLSKHMNLPSKK